MKYEIEFVYHGSNHGMTNIFCSLTGLSPEEIKPLMKDRFKGSDFKRIFQELGYNTNARFITFDPETKYPTVLRLKGKSNSYWYAFVYANGKIWDPWNNKIYRIDDESFVRKMKAKYFLTASWFYGQPLKITSMLQVWI